MTKVWVLITTLLFPFILAFGQDDAEIVPISASLNFKSYEVGAGDQLNAVIEISILDEFKVYEDQFRLTVVSPQGVKVGTPKIEGGFEFFDKFSKKNRRGIKHHGKLAVILELPTNLKAGEQSMEISLRYQACAETYCLFPKSITIKAPFKVKPDPFLKNQALVSDGSILQNSFQEAKERGLGFVFGFVFLAGILTSLTPCILPMLPITIAILGKGHPARRKRTRFFHALIYVFGMAITYAVLGIAAASSGALFGAVLSHPAVQIGFAALFIVMGVAAFGFFEVQTPLFLQNRINRIAKIPGNFGLFLAGLFSGLIAGPCVGPVLVGILTFVAQTQDVWLGFWLLFVYAIGLGQLLIILGVSTHLLDKMPRNGSLMKVAKVFLGTALIAAGLFYGSLVWPKAVPSFTGPVEEVSYQKLPWLPYSEALVQKAKADGNPIIIDFYAEWCLACKELEYKTFADSTVAESTKGIILLKFDATEDSEELAVLKKQYGIIGLPTMIFIDKAGVWRKELTLNEFESPDKFILRVQKLLAL